MYRKQFKIHRAFGNLYRKKHALIFCIDQDKKILVGAKPNFYPKGINRLLGGGIREGENELDAATRELQEETGLKVRTKELTQLAVINIEATTDKKEVFNMTTSIYAILVDKPKVKAGDDVKQVISLTKKEFKELIVKFCSLPDDFWYEGVEGNHSWGDYGAIYGFIHRIALEEAEKRHLLD